MTTDPMTEAVGAASRAMDEAIEIDRGVSWLTLAQAAINEALPILRAQFAQEVAVAIEAEFEDWRTCGGETITEFPLHSGQWLVRGAYESTARIARNWGTK